MVWAYGRVVGGADSTHTLLLLPLLLSPHYSVYETAPGALSNPGAPNQLKLTNERQAGMEHQGTTLSPNGARRKHCSVLSLSKASGQAPSSLVILLPATLPPCDCTSCCELYFSTTHPPKATSLGQSSPST